MVFDSDHCFGFSYKSNCKINLGLQVLNKRTDNFHNLESIFVEIKLADELFFTGTAAEVVPIRSVDKKLISEGERGEKTTFLQKNYFLK